MRDECSTKENFKHMNKAAVFIPDAACLRSGPYIPFDHLPEMTFNDHVVPASTGGPGRSDESEVDKAALTACCVTKKGTTAGVTRNVVLPSVKYGPPNETKYMGNGPE